MTIEIHLEDQEGELVEQARELLESLTGSEVESHAVTPKTTSHRGDPVAIAALVLAAPGAIVATLDLVQRAKLAEKVSKLLGTARRSRRSATLRKKQRKLDLKTASDDDVIDILIER